MTENMKAFLNKVSVDKALAEEASKLDQAGLIAFARELGLELMEADFSAAANELSEDELDTVAGGKVCACVVGGGGEGGGEDNVCVCPLYGVGADEDKYYDRCVCIVGGGGKSYN